MTTIITRMYGDEKAANAVADALRARSFPESTFDVISGKSDVAERMSAARVDAAEAEVYGSMVESGNALVVVRAPFTPFGAARAAMEICDGGGPLETTVEQPNRYADFDGPAVAKEMQIQHRYWGRVVPHILNESNSMGRGRAPFRFSSDLFGFPTLKQMYWGKAWGHLLNESNSGGRGRAPFRFSSGMFGFPLIKHRYWANVPGHILNESNSGGRGAAPFRFSSGMFGFPTIKHRYWANFPGHILNESNSGGRGRAPFRFSSDLFGIPTLIRR